MLRLCLVVVSLSACSVDIGKLHAPTADAPLGQPGADARRDGAADVARPVDDVMVDRWAPSPEVADPVEDTPSDRTTDRPEPEDAGELEDLATADEGDLATDDEDTADAWADATEATMGTGGAPGDGAGTGGAGTGGIGTGGIGTGGIGTGGIGTGGIGTGGIDTGGAGGSGGQSGTGGRSGSGGAGIDPDLVLWYKFDESSGRTAADSSGQGMPQNATLATYGTSGTAAFSTDSQVGTHALSLAPSAYGSTYGGGYVTVPAIQPLAPDALTLAFWVKLAGGATAQQWERVFDFGTGQTSTGGYLYMTSRMGGATTGSPVRFGISKVGRPSSGFNTNEQRLENTTTLTTNVWHHIAVVLPLPASPGSPYTGTLYIDGEVAVTNDAMTLHLSDLVVTSNNWLGRSQFENDPFFYGMLDDFRVYRRALSQAEISALMSER